MKMTMFLKQNNNNSNLLNNKTNNKKNVKTTNHQLFKILSMSNSFIFLLLLLDHNLEYVEASVKQQSIVDKSTKLSAATPIEHAEQASHFSAVKTYLNHEDYHQKEKGK